MKKKKKKTLYLVQRDVPFNYSPRKGGRGRITRLSYRTPAVRAILSQTINHKGVGGRGWSCGVGTRKTVMTSVHEKATGIGLQTGIRG